MDYISFVETYEKLAGTSKMLEKTEILAKFFRMLREEGKSEWVYLLKGKVTPDHDSREFGISGQLTIKALSKSFGISSDIVSGMFNKIGDFGEIAQELASKKRQAGLFSSKLSVEKVFENLSKLLNVEGKGAIDIKLNLISELFASASPLEAKYIARTLLNDLRLGVADGLIKDAIAFGFYQGNEEVKELIQEKYDLANDLAYIFRAAVKGKKELEKIEIVPGRPINVMLPVKINNVEDGFKICGKPAAFEHKYDGFRVLINKSAIGINLFTRKLENVTKQFPDVVDAVEKHIKGESFVIDSEVVGFNSKSGKYQPFEAISQRIKRKYDIDKLIKELPVEVNVFDILYLDGDSVMNKPFSERRKILEKVVKEKDKVIRASYQIITDDEKIAEKFYKEALKSGEEGVMIKNLSAPYTQGRRVGNIVKLKPEVADLDLVIVGAEHGSGKRGGWLTSFIVACRNNGDFLEVGKVSSGLKEKEEEGTSYYQMTKLLKPLILSENGKSVRVSPKIVVSVTYQNFQESPGYSSGYAMRFPRITRYRSDRSVKDIANLDEIKKIFREGKR